MYDLPVESVHQGIGFIDLPPTSTCISYFYESCDETKLKLSYW